jgi:hypothetical protein
LKLHSPTAKGVSVFRKVNSPCPVWRRIWPLRTMACAGVVRGARNRGRAARRCIERVLGFGLVAGGNSTVVRVWGHMGVKGELGLWPPPGF